MYSLVQMYCGAGEPFASIFAYIEARRRVDLLVESAGLFWIAAELVILFLVIAGRRHIDTEPAPVQFALTRAEKRRALAGSIGFALVSLVVLSRYFLAREVEAETAAAVLSSRVHIHIAVWASFVTVWVVLETVIVYHGWRGYRRLCRMLGGTDARPAVAIATCLILACAASLFSWHAAGSDLDAVRQAICDANAADQVYWNALYLYLRIAGVVWIAVEWWAAVVLVKGYRMLARAVALRKVSP